MVRPIHCALSLVLVASLGQAAFAQSAQLRVLAPNSAPIRAVSRPSLHNGVYAGFGLRSSDSRYGIYAGRLSDPPGTLPTMIAAEGDPIPNNPPRIFGFLRIPTVWNGLAYFTGGPTGASTLSDGTYARGLDGGPLSVVADRLSGFEPWIELPFAGADGLAFVNQGVTSGTGAGISLWTYDHRLIPLVSYDQPLADGTQVSSTTASRVAYGGDTIAYSMRAGFPDHNAAGMGVFAYNTTSGQTTRVVDMTTPIPGDGRLMEILGAVDTDGSLVAFGAGNGHLYFGGTAAVCVANVDGSDLRTIVRTGQPMPGLPGRTHFSVGNSAVSNGIVWFQSTYRDGANERLNLFAHILATNTTIPVILFTQSIAGVTSNTPWFDPRGVDGLDAVIECEAPTANMGVSILTLVHAHINLPPTCLADMDNGTGSGTPDGGVTIDDLLFYLAVYEAGVARADVDNGTATGTPDGGVTIDDLLYFLLRFEAGC
jgi:hypothetical protein